MLNHLYVGKWAWTRMTSWTTSVIKKIPNQTKLILTPKCETHNEQWQHSYTNLSKGDITLVNFEYDSRFCHIDHIPSTRYYVPGAMYYVPGTLYHVPCPMYYEPCTVYHPCTMYHVPWLPCTMHHVPCIVYRVPCIMYHVPCTMYHVPCPMDHVPT